MKYFEVNKELRIFFKPAITPHLLVKQVMSACEKMQRPILNITDTMRENYHQNITHVALWNNQNEKNQTIEIHDDLSAISILVKAKIFLDESVDIEAQKEKLECELHIQEFDDLHLCHQKYIEAGVSLSLLQAFVNNIELPNLKPYITEMDIVTYGDFEIATL